LKDLDSVMNDINEKENNDKRELDSEISPIVDIKQNNDENDDSVSGIMSVNDYGRISYDKFDAIDLRVAKILDVEVHPSTRKPMYKLTVDLGELGKRTIVAGIGAFYGIEDLIDKKIVVVANLAPRKIAGILSDGMLLAAEDELSVSLIVPDKNASPGSRIH